MLKMKNAHLLIAVTAITQKNVNAGKRVQIVDSTPLNILDENKTMGHMGRQANMVYMCPETSSIIHSILYLA